jgi:hypothetical protein
LIPFKELLQNCGRDQEALSVLHVGRELADLLGMVPVRQDKLCELGGSLGGHRPESRYVQRNVRAQSSAWTARLT